MSLQTNQPTDRLQGSWGSNTSNNDCCGRGNGRGEGRAEASYTDTIYFNFILKHNLYCAKNKE